eukprot:Nitzschia sp. Nitz4//scaffold49_size126201//90005//90538//NITZ4_003653-RA/size126201-processed-gene-0.74-mRNA-1//1//CDS//3329553182//914//frame0
MTNSDLSSNTPRDELAKHTQDAWDLINGYAKQEPPAKTTNKNSSSENPWSDPETMLQELSSARENLVNAWTQVRDEMVSSEEKQSTSVAPQDFRSIYMEKVTLAFGDVLESLATIDHPETEQQRVDIMVDCLSSGVDLFTDSEKALWYRNHTSDDSSDMDEDKETPHQKRRRERGFL